MKSLTTRFLLIGAAIVLISACNSSNNSSNNTSSSDKVQTKEVSLAYEFEKKASLTGKLQELKYENLAGTAMTTYLLVLNNAINVTSNNTEFESQNNIKEVQIGFSDDVKQPSDYLNKSITVDGEIYPEQTVNDRRPVVMINAIIK